jgi:DNA-binding transcriptional regulator YdaS (Cro superfamily)
MSTQALKKAIKEVGGQATLARLIGKRQGHIGNWLHRDKKVPAEVCADIEAATGGKVTREELRPDVFRTTPSIDSTHAKQERAA